MDEVHASAYTIHPGSTKMYKDLKRYYWWDGMKRDVDEHVAKCLICQQVKEKHQRPADKLQQLSITQWKWDNGFCVCSSQN